MNKKLRLLVTTKCPNNCTMCCNKQFDFSTLPIVDRWDYDEIMITGGEPSIFYNEVESLIVNIKDMMKYQGKEPKIYVYTSTVQYMFNIIFFAEGIAFTPHTKNDIKVFESIINTTNWNLFKDRSLIIKLDKEMKSLLSISTEELNSLGWKVKEFEWIENCPLPEGEDFRRINELW